MLCMYVCMYAFSLYIYIYIIFEYMYIIFEYMYMIFEYMYIIDMRCISYIYVITYIYILTYKYTYCTSKYEYTYRHTDIHTLIHIPWCSKCCCFFMIFDPLILLVKSRFAVLVPWNGLFGHWPHIASAMPVLSGQRMAVSVVDSERVHSAEMSKLKSGKPLVHGSRSGYISKGNPTNKALSRYQESRGEKMWKTTINQDYRLPTFLAESSVSRLHVWTSADWVWSCVHSVCIISYANILVVCQFGALPYRNWMKLG